MKSEAQSALKRCSYSSFHNSSEAPSLGTRVLLLGGVIKKKKKKQY